MLIRRFVCGILVVLPVATWVAAAQATSVPQRESLNDAWWTGPMLAPNASTIPKGHILVEPYLYDAITQGFYDSTGTRRSIPHENGFGSLTYINFGVFNGLTLGLIPTFGYNEVSQGLNSAGVGMGDLTVQAQYRLKQFHEGGWLPTASINVQETFPTGRYDHLGDRTSDGFGGGAYTTTLSLFTQTYLWMPTGRILRLRFNLSQAFSNTVNIADVSVYGTSQGFQGHASPGSSFLVDLAGEYSLTQHWVFALDAVFRHQYNTPVTGYYLSDPSTLVSLNSGISQAWALAPAVEYNLTSKLGFLVGTRLFPAGRNTTYSITPAIAVNYVH